MCPYSLTIVLEIKNTNYHYAVIKERAAMPQGCELPKELLARKRASP